MIDFRSDTVTQPSAAMRSAMANAEVGDDVLGEDPTVRRLEERAMELTGKQAAVFVPSGTMGNQAAIAAHTRPGQEIICDDRMHIVLYEFGMPARFSGGLVRAIPTPDGLLQWDDVQQRLRGESDHYRGAGLIVVENTHNMAGGRVYPLERLDEIGRGSRAAGVPLHMDGARVFNAACALGVEVERIARAVDSMCFCLSKGLGAPVGSVLVGSADFVAEARHARKALGGGMRQAGVLAAAGLVALEETPPLLPEDHRNARFVAEALAEIPGLAVDLVAVETNIVFVETPQAPALRKRLAAEGVGVSGSDSRLRLVTHRDVDRSQCERAVQVIRNACSA